MMKVHEFQHIDYTKKTVLALDQRFTRDNLFNDNQKCNVLFNNFTMPPIFFSHLLAEVISPNLTLRVCKQLHQQEFNVSNDCQVEALPNVADAPAPPPSPLDGRPLYEDCKLVYLPVDVPPNSTFHGRVDPVLQLFTAGFRLRWSLPQPCHQCEKNGKKTRRLIIGIAIVSSLIIAITLAILVYCLRRMPIWEKRTIKAQNVEAFLRNYGSLAPKRYSYSDIKKMTNSFKEKVGQGGYGSVFKGKLPDGRLVAVKVLNDSKGDGKEFINEVASISRTSHVNIVAFLGFCFDDSKRALIYEFMSNGSLEKFIYNRKSVETCHHLGWERLHQIAVSIAQGLEYLHRGCNTPILHFDIKPHNILLDKDFCPKISDFGLAKLCPRKDSVISMADARGTVGYIAPEVFSWNFGGVSHKSDVYSYGMMILEMVGGRKNIDAGVDNTSEIYFPHWIYEHMGQGEHLHIDMVMREEEEEIARKMVLVGLWCIQMNSANRPSMNRVVDMLEGNLESLPIPPKPFLSSPPR